MKTITIENLKQYGFTVYSENKNKDTISLQFSINNWKIIYNKYYDGEIKFAIEADGGHYYSGYFDLNHLKSIEQLDLMIKGMLGTLEI
jgi:hypothetical protein